MKKTALGLMTSIFLVSLGIFFYFFEHIGFVNTSKKVIGPFTALHPDPIYYGVPLHWAYIFTATGVVIFLVSLYLNHKNPHTR